MTFWVTVASRPPHSAGQVMAAHRPVLSVRCQARRRSICAMIPPLPRRRPLGALVLGPLGEELGQVLVEPADQLVPEGLVLGRVGEVHATPATDMLGLAGRSLHATCQVASRTLDGVRPRRRPAGPAGHGPVVPRRAGAVGLRPLDARRRPGRPDGPGVTDDLWRKLVDLGWVGLLVPEEQGGTGRRPARGDGGARGDGPAAAARSRKGVD